MKRLSSIVLCVLAGMVTAGSALAQTPAVQAKVPFAFAVGRAWLPAGEYIITQESLQQIRIEDAATGRMVAFGVTQPENLAAKGPGNLLFHRYGEYYFLTSITNSDMATTVTLPTSSQERRVEKMQEEAMQGGDPGVVLVALNR
jgi:hypothetical protein